MQTFQSLTSQQTELLTLLDAGAKEEAEKLFKQLSPRESYTLVLLLHERSKQPSTTVAKQHLPKLPLEAVSLCAEDHNGAAEPSDYGQDNEGCEHGEFFTLSAVGGNISTETPRLDFGRARGDDQGTITGLQGHQPTADSQALMKQSLAQRVAAAGGYNNKASLDLQLGDSVADFNLLASRLGGFGPARMSMLVAAADVQANTTNNSYPISEFSSATEQSAHGSSSPQQAANDCQRAACQEPAATDSVGLNSDVLAASTGMAFGSSVSSEDVELSIPSCSSSPKEAPSSSKAVSQQNISAMRQSAAEMRASALVGPMSIKLDDLREGEDTASEPTTPGSIVSALSVMQQPMRTPTVTPVSTGALDSNLSTPSTVGSSVSQHRYTETPAVDSSRHHSGLGRVLFAPVSALRKSLTGKRVPKQPMAATAGGISSCRERAAATTPTSSRHSAAGTGRPQSRLPSFSATAGHTSSSSSRTAGNSGTPSSGYRPPSSLPDVSGRTASSAGSRSPLGQGPDRAGNPSAAGAMFRPDPSGVVGSAARSPLPGARPGAQKTAVIGTKTSSISVSAGLAWLQQHGDPDTPPPAASSSKAPLSARRTSSRPVGNPAAAEAPAAICRAVGLKSAPVSPANSRPGTSHSVRSVASAAPHTHCVSSVHPSSRIGAGAGGNASARGSASSSRIPGFSVTEQMVVGKQHRSTPPSSARTAPAGSARSATSAATSTSAASFMRQIAGINIAGGAAGGGRTASRLPTGDGRQLQTTSSHIESGNSFGTEAAAQGHKAGTRLVNAAVTAVATTKTSNVRAGGHYVAGIEQASSSRIGAGAVKGAGRGAVNGTSQLRRSRSFGSLSDLHQQTSHQDVSQIRQMWQKRAAAHCQQQQQPYQQQQQPRDNSLSACSHTSTPAAGPARSGLSRIPMMSAAGHAAEAAAGRDPAGDLEPEECESPPALKEQRRSSSSSGHATSTGGVAAGHVPASDLLGRIDDIIQKARTPTDRMPPAHLQAVPPAVLTAAEYPACAATAASASEGFSSKSRRAALGDCEKVTLVQGTGNGTHKTDRHLPNTSQALHNGAFPGMQAVQHVPMDSSSAGRDQQMASQSATALDSINKQLF